MGLLGSLHRVIDRYVSLEKTLDDWKHLSTDVWEGLDEDLIVAIAKQDEGFAKYDKEYTDVTRKYEKAIDRCKIISNKASQAQNVTETAPPSTNENRPNGVKTQGVFRPLADLKPVFLNKDCNLIEYLEFTKAFVLYMQSSGTQIPRDAVFSHLRVHVDAWWQHYIEYVGLTINSDIPHFLKMMDTAARDKFPMHARRMKVFAHVQKGDTMTHFRQIIESIKLAEWSSFNEDSAAMHIFMATTKDEVAKRACFKILGESPEGDVRQLMNKITAIEAFPESRTPTFSAKPIITTDVPRKSCTTCKRTGHLASECWGRCSHCSRFGHKSQVCRSRPQAPPQVPATEPVVKKNEGARKKKTDGSRKKKRAKTIKELTEMVQSLNVDSPNISESESSESDSNTVQSVHRVQVKSPQAGPSSRRDRRSTSYSEITSDNEVINALNRSKIASINVKKTKNSKGMSHADGLVSNSLDFRSARVEILLLDSGAQVNIVGEAIARDAKVRIIKLKQERFVTEASGNRLNIIGVCIFYIKLPCLNNPKKLECLVLRGKSVDREILISCEALLKWDLIHSTFGQETVTNYCNRINSTNYSRNF